VEKYCTRLRYYLVVGVDIHTSLIVDGGVLH
jgi:hypothetical protein